MSRPRSGPGHDYIGVQTCRMRRVAGYAAMATWNAFV
jgi:hypothetical protein